MASCFSAVKKQNPGSVFAAVHVFDVLGQRRAGCVAGWVPAWQGSMVWLLAPVTRLLVPAGLHRLTAGEGCARLHTHTAYRNTRSCERGWRKD